MSTANRSDATAPSRVNSQSPLRRATTVMTAALTPLKTTSAPSIVPRHARRERMKAEGGRRKARRPRLTAFTSSFILPPSSFSEGDAHGLHYLAQDFFGLLAAAVERV